jgi:hypothetical protein
LVAVLGETKKFLAKGVFSFDSLMPALSEVEGLDKQRK